MTPLQRTSESCRLRPVNEILSLHSADIELPGDKSFPALPGVTERLSPAAVRPSAGPWRHVAVRLEGLHVPLPRGPPFPRPLA